MHNPLEIALFWLYKMPSPISFHMFHIQVSVWVESGSKILRDLFDKRPAVVVVKIPLGMIPVDFSTEWTTEASLHPPTHCTEIASSNKVQ